MRPPDRSVGGMVKASPLLHFQYDVVRSARYHALSLSDDAGYEFLRLLLEEGVSEDADLGPHGTSFQGPRDLDTP